MSSKLAITAAPRVRPAEPRHLPDDESLALDKSSPLLAAPLIPVRRARGTRSGWPTRIALAISDLLAVSVALVLARLALASVLGMDFLALSRSEVQLALLFAAATLAVAATQGLYACLLVRPVVELRQCVFVAALVSLLLGGMVAASGAFSMGNALWLLVSGVLAAGLLPVYRALCRMACGSAGWWGIRVIIVGSGGLAARTWERLERRPQYGLRPAGFVDDEESPAAAVDPNLCLGTLDMLGQVAHEQNARCALVAASAFESEEIASLMARTSHGIDQWIVLPALECFPSLWATAAEVAGRPALTLKNRLALPSRRWAKRVLDLTLTLCLGMLALPLMLLIAVLVRLSSPGPIFYGDERVGRYGRRFLAWKFRTMLPNANQVLQNYLAENPEYLAEWQTNIKLRHDPRITWIGRILRRTSLDELPQIWNVLLGEMSLVGPRPILPEEIEKYGENYEHYVKMLPGITGLWQVSGRNSTTYEERLEYATYYVKNWSPWLDLYILACTIKVVLRGEGAY